MRIGYFIPEFPGQTHIFFWREWHVLKELGVEADWVSTRPPKAISSHTWAREAGQNTSYLVPFTFRDGVEAATTILKAGPRHWLRCLSSIFQAKNLSFSQRLRLLALLLPGAKLAHIAQLKEWSHIHVHSCADAAHIAMFASLLTEIPYSLTLHGPTLEVYGPNQEQKWKHASFGIVVSQKLIEDIQKKLAGSLPEKILFAPMGVNINTIKRSIPYSVWHEGTPCRIFVCGRLNRVKGHKDLIQAIKILRDQGVDVRLQIAGEDEQGGSGYHKELELFIQSESLSEFVSLLGAVSEETVRSGLENAHIFALASLNEGIPVAVMEAMAMEMPVIVTDVGGNSELIAHGVDGLLVPSESPQELAVAIHKVLLDKDFALSLSQQSRRKIVTDFHHRKSGEILAQCLDVSSPKLVSHEWELVTNE
jgi:glycosyltransferase involved in cell wall biosynthesis